MFTLQAPYPTLVTTTLLRNPQFSDSEGLTVVVTRKTAMDGTTYTYVKNKGRKHLKWTFKVTRNKALELRAFIQLYFADKIKVIDHNGRNWVGQFLNNPFEFTTIERWGPAIDPMPRGEAVSIDIEFEGVEQ